MIFWSVVTCSDAPFSEGSRPFYHECQIKQDAEGSIVDDEKWLLPAVLFAAVRVTRPAEFGAHSP
jgi:hypothetical protein